MSFDALEAARLLVEARRNRKRLPDLPQPPATLEQAYAVQDAIIGHLGPIGGWKVGPWRTGEVPACAPIPARYVHDSPADLPSEEMPDAEAEVEIAVRLARSLPPRGTPYGPDDIRAAIASAHLAIEVISSRFTDRRTVAALTGIADSQNNGGIVVGPGRADWAALDLATVAMRLERDDVEIATAQGGPSTEDVMLALAWLATHAAERCGGLREGQIVITGARISPNPIAGSRVRATASGLEPVSLALRPETAR
jgi:2-keto-4-pentenoate hydratase